MNSRRFMAVALLCVALTGCHEDPTVTVNFPSNAGTLTITTDGGTALFTPTNAAGTGKDAGTVNAKVVGDMNLGGGGSLTAPTAPTAPTTGTTLDNTAALAGTPIHGNILLTTTLQITPAVPGAATTHTIETDTGDIVISGSLIAAQSTDPVTCSIHLIAPAGTVYITGTLSAAGSPGTVDNPNGGDLTIDAARIVITGTINAQGEAGTLAGGNGGKVSMTSSSGNILVTGTINTSGGIGTAAGNGGDIDLTAGNTLQIFNNLTAEGGASTDTGGVTAPAGGKAGAVLLNGNGGVDVSGLVSLHGGDATGSTAGAAGGDGNDFNINSPVPVRLYGSIITRGGNATATAGSSVTLVGGAAGGVYLGQLLPSAPPGTNFPLATLELGTGTWSTSGGSGPSAAGNAKDMDFQTVNGTVKVGAILNAKGGNATGSLDTPGGAGGNIIIKTDQDPASVGNHALTMLFGVDTTIPGGPTTNITAAMTTTGGAGTGAVSGLGGAGGNIVLSCGGDLSSAIVMTTTGGSTVDGTGGKAGDVTLTIASTAGALGDAVVSGTFMMNGGASSGSTTGAGGDGGAFMIDLSTSTTGSITSSASMTTSGANGLGSLGGLPGDVTLSTQKGDIILTGPIAAVGGSSPTGPRKGANVAVTCGSTGVAGGSITSSVAINVNGGVGNGISTAGADGGKVHFEALNTSGSVQLLVGSAITANGGNSTGASAAGMGGTVELFTQDQLVSIFGTISALGGSAPGGGTGGLGGQVTVNTDTNADGLGGDITLQSGSSINVSGGSGATGGSARNAGTVPAGPAVVFDADSGAVHNAGSEGVVQNLGTITANGASSGGNGGTIFFDGRSTALGVAPFPDPVSGSVNVSGAVIGSFSSN